MLGRFNEVTMNKKIIRNIIVLKNKLKETDYITLKFVEGAISKEEYEATRLLRQGYRDKINELQSLL